MRILNTTLFFSMIALISCKKDKLKGNSSTLIGSWKWSLTQQTSNLCDPDYLLKDTLTPETHGINYELEFYKKGKLYFYENNSIVNKYRIVLVGFSENPTLKPQYPYGFTIYLDNEVENTLSGFVGSDSLAIIDGLPFPDTDCEDYLSYFARQ